MALSEYDKKRHFDSTPEPKGEAKDTKGPLRFVVQKHDATALHYDFRLEVDGVLKSWAVPKGPSLKPSDHHLAIHVEDHPFDYRNFEGVIPEGNYGAGPVMIWDEGVYIGRGSSDRESTEKEMRAGLKKGHITFILDGQKLKGEFALVKFHEGEDPKAWLLIKKGDEFAKEIDITKEDKSARSGRSLEEIASDSEGVAAKPLHSIKPMLCTLVEEAFDGDEWLFEIKWDGYRAIAEVDHGKVKLYSRNGQPFESKFESVAKVLTQIKHQAVLDGEVIAAGEDGKPSFQSLQDYAGSQASLVYEVFDILYLDGKDLTKLPLVRRKELLKTVLPESPRVKLSEHIEKTGKSFFAAAKEQGLEGIVAKRQDSIYQQGKRGRDWLKIKTHLRQEAVICGFTEPRGGRQKFGALVLGVYEAGKLVYIGHAGGGFDEKSLEAVYSKMKPLVVKNSPFDIPPKTNEPATWLKPELVCEVKFQEWTREGTMRQPIFLGQRPDKKANDVKRELPK